MSQVAATPSSSANRSAQLAALQFAQKKPRNLWRDAFSKLLRNRLAIFGLIITSLLIFTAIFGDFIAPYPYTRQDLLRTAEGPSADHWLGTDEVGRDLLSRVIGGARTATMVAFVSTFFSVIIGMVMGIVASYGGRWVNAFVVRMIDITMSIPPVLLAAIIAATIKQPIVNWAKSVGQSTGWTFLLNTGWLELLIVFGGLSFVYWPVFARLIRGQILSLREKEFIEAARAVGVPARQIATRYLMPNALGPIVVQMTFTLGAGMVLESSLSYLGIGVMPPQASWGNMISSNAGSWSYRPWLVAVPAATLAIAALGVNFLGDGLNDALNPQSQSSKAI
jgi:peptide/nickel transport system permease protein